LTGESNDCLKGVPSDCSNSNPIEWLTDACIYQFQEHSSCEITFALLASMDGSSQCGLMSPDMSCSADWAGVMFSVQLNAKIS